MREGKPSELSVKLGELQASQAANNPTAPSAEAQGNKLGIAVQPLTAALASELGIGDAVSGLLKRNVDPSGPGAEAGLTPGDVIVQVNRVPVRTVAELEKIVDAAGSESFPLLINRRGRTFFVVVEPR